MNVEISLKIENEEIVFADLTERENLEVIIVCKSGNIFLFDCKSNNYEFIKLLTFPSYKLNLQLYSFQNYICIVQKNGTFGMVLDLSNPNYQKQLERGDYHADFCSFPIAFYETNNKKFLIHGTDWNRLDITCLNTDELLTNRMVDYETKSNYFDYFHSSLLISPDSKYFTSNGWVWQPYAIITVYSVENFLKEFELSHVSLDFERVDGYNWDRPLCWINNTTVGIGYNRKEDDEEEIKENFPSEIVFVNVLDNKIINRIEFNGFGFSDYGAVIGNLFFDKSHQFFIGLNKQSGALITDFQGKEIYKNVNLVAHQYPPKHKFFYQLDYKKQFLKLTKIKEL